MKLITENFLIDLIKDRNSFRTNSVLYVDRNTKWSSLSRAYVYEFDEEENIPLDLNGIPYFIEMELLKEVIEVWHQWNEKNSISVENECLAVIYYAENDSYKPVI